MEDVDWPDGFFSKRWPNPKLINNSPVAKDKALKWYMESIQPSIVADWDVDILNLGFNSRAR